MPEVSNRYSRVRIITLVLLVLFAAGFYFGFGGRQPPAPPMQPPFVPPDSEVLVANLGSNSIVGFALGANGRVDTVPARIIGGGLSPETQSGLRNPFWLTLDRGGRIFTSNPGDLLAPAVSTEPPRITIHEADANGEAAPFTEFDRSRVGYANPRGLAVRRNPAALFIVNASASGAPAVISKVIESELPGGGPGRGTLREATMLVEPAGVALDGAGNVYVADAATDSIRVFAAWPAFTDCPCPPARSIAGRNTALDRPLGLAFDSRGNLLVTNYRQDQTGYGYIAVFAPGAQGDVAPIQIIGVPYVGSGAAPELRRPIGIALDRADRIYVTQEDEVLVFERNASGNASALQRLRHEKLNVTTGIAVRQN